MKVVVGVLIVGAMTALLADNFPWWCCGIIAFIVGFAFRLKSGIAFITGLLGVALAWGIMAGWMDARNTGLLSSKIGMLFGGLSSFLLVAITALIGGLVGGLGSMTGGTLAQLVFKSQTRTATG